MIGFGSYISTTFSSQKLKSSAEGMLFRGNLETTLPKEAYLNSPTWNLYFEKAIDYWNNSTFNCFSFWLTKTTSWSESYRCTVLAERVGYFAFSYSVTPAKNWYFVLFNNSLKFWSTIKTRDSFGICSSWKLDLSYWANHFHRMVLKEH